MFVYILLALSICLSLYAVFRVVKLETKDNSHRYYMYVGLNDNDTDEQKYSFEEASKIISDIAFKYTKGFNILSACGGFAYPDGRRTFENSVVISFNYIKEEDIQLMGKDILEALNQAYVFYEAETLTTGFVLGNGSSEMDQERNI